MKLLLDTHTFLWFLEDDVQLSSTARTLIEDGDNEVYLSVGSLWEMAIKISLGKLHIRQAFDSFVPEQLALNNIAIPPHHREQRKSPNIAALSSSRSL